MKLHFLLVPLLIISLKLDAFAQAAPASPMLQTGCRFNEADLGEMEVDSNWFEIPSWLAGVWKREKSTQKILGFIPLTRMDVRMRKYGFQTDSKGGIWHLVRTPYKTVTQTQGRKNVFVCWQEYPVSVSSDEVKVSLKWTVWCVSNYDSKIIEVRQGEQIDTYRPNSSTEIKVESNLKNSTESGQAFFNSKVKWKDSKVSEYAPLDVYRGLELRPMLDSYLRSVGKNELVPNVQTENTN